LLPAICSAVPCVSTSFLDGRIISHVRHTCCAVPVGGGSVPKILVEHALRLSDSIAASSLSFRIGFSSLSLHTSAFLLDSFLNSACIPGEECDQTTGHQTDVKPVAG
jgi:hypothetical protein